MAKHANIERQLPLSKKWNLEKKISVWIYNIVLKSQKRSKSQHIQPHKEPFQETKGVPHGSQSNHRSCRRFKGIVPQPSQQKTKVEKGFFIKFCGCSFCLMEWTLGKSMEAHKVLEKIVPEKTLSAWTEIFPICVIGLIRTPTSK